MRNRHGARPFRLLALLKPIRLNHSKVSRPMPIATAANCLLPLACLVSLAASPALAASTDAAMLAGYAGNYTGAGTINAGRPQAVRCRLMMTPGRGGALDYTGRCSAGGAGFSIMGAIVATAGRFTATMSGAGGGFAGSGTVPGTRRGNDIVFAAKTRDVAAGHDRAITSSFSLANGRVAIQFSVLDNRTGKTTTGAVSFARAGG